MELKEKIKFLLSKKSARYITKEFIVSSYDENTYNEILSRSSFLDESCKLSERLFVIINDIIKINNCICCGKSISKIYFHSYNELTPDKYNNPLCSISCHRKNKKTHQVKPPVDKVISNEKRKQTNILKYGVDNVSKLHDIKQKIKETVLKNYGVDNYSKTEESKQIIRKKIDGNKIREKILETTYERLINKPSSVLVNFNRTEYQGSGYDKIYSWKCKDCETEFSKWYHNGVIPECPNCNKGTTKIERFIIQYLQKNNISFEFRNRTILSNNYELDFYIPSYNIAIECNGNYFHSELGGNKFKYYHQNKQKECLEKGISQLITIFEDELLKKPKIVISRLNHIFKINKRKIYGRNCEVKEISYTDVSKFLNKYHIQGTSVSSINYGLFYHNRLVSVMSFGKARASVGRDGKDEWELIRYCGNFSFYVIGGANKLFKMFCKEHKGKIISYADCRWSNGNLYEKLGFDKIRLTNPNYYYTKNYMNREHRYNYRKHILSKKLDVYDGSLTEWENMKNNGFDRIWDCGSLVFSYENNK